MSHSIDRVGAVFCLAPSCTASVEHCCYRPQRVIVYPNYLDSTKTVAEGRVIPKELACILPNVFEMLDCCKALKLEAEVEEKHYPRTWWIRGRLRVNLKRADGKPANPDIPTRRVLLIKLAELVTQHPMRQGRPPPVSLHGMPSALLAAATGEGMGPGSSGSGKAASVASSTPSTNTSTTSNKKKSKNNKK
ncbi:hypothetical protein QJQ45_018439 [Haematococcus lacustris]|nr:hypothetical protein QJQ45_018439 [Haematococcus lacustris]